MKSTARVIPKKQAWLDLKRDKWSTRSRDAPGEWTARFLEINVQRIDRPSVARVETAPTTANLRPAAKTTDPADPPACSRRLTVQAKPRRPSTATVAPHSVLLPPINGSRLIAGKAERDAVPLSTGGLTLPKNRLSISSVMREKAVFRVLVARHGEGSQPPQKSHLVSGAQAALNKGQDAETCSRLVKRPLHSAQPAAAPAPPLPPPPPGPSVATQQRNDAARPSANDSGVVMTTDDGIKPDASLCEAKRQQRDFPSEDSAIETQSQCSEDRDGPKTGGGASSLCPDEDEGYYTEERIADWVLKVNSSLFFRSNDEEEVSSSSAREEQDTATIKIIYDGD